MFDSLKTHIRFKIIDSINEIDHYWKPLKHSFNVQLNSALIVDRNGKDEGHVVSNGHHYRMYEEPRYKLIEATRLFSPLERLGRVAFGTALIFGSVFAAVFVQRRLRPGFLGTLLIITTLFITVMSKFARDLFTQEYQRAEFGIPLGPSSLPAHRRRFGKAPSPSLTLDKTPSDPVEKLPTELSLRIFSYLNSAERKRCRVNKTWKELLEDPTLPRHVDDITLGKNIWKYLGDVGNVPPLPDEAHDMLKDPHVKDVRFFLMPATINGEPLTLNTFIELINSESVRKATGYNEEFRVGRIFTKAFGDTPLFSQSYWMQVIGLTVNESPWNDEKDKKLIDQLNKGIGGPVYDTPNALELLIISFLKYIVSPERPRNIYISCKEKVSLMRGSRLPPVIVGNFSHPPIVACWEAVSGDSKRAYYNTAVRRFQS